MSHPGDYGDGEGRHDHPTKEIDDAAELDELLAFVRLSRQIDFTGYKRSGLARRIRKRMGELGCKTYPEYQEQLEVNPDEFRALIDTILINVTSFFRDPPAWEYLADEVLTRIVSAKQPGEPIRVWSTGCATGEETYSLAITLCEALGVDEFRRRVKIYGTDADEDAVASARASIYSPKAIATVPAELRQRYFVEVDGHVTFRTDLRHHVIFGRHDLTRDAPISKLDLLACRNTLMYFNSETQATILERFWFALSEHGFLMLGKAETLLATPTRFRPLDLRMRMFTKIPGRQRASREPGRATSVAPLDGQDLRDLALDASIAASFVLDDGGRLAEINAGAREVLGLRRSDIGALIQDLEISYRPVELRAALDDALAQRRTITIDNVHWSPFARRDGDRTYDVQVQPLIDGRGTVAGASVSFVDVSTAHRLERELEQSNRDLTTAYEELQSTNEELETTNEELQSTIEELETTNEELQSTNEQMETMNEELQSSNDELIIVNQELEMRSIDLTQANLSLEGILGKLERGVVVLDRETIVRRWSPWCVRMFGRRADEVVGRPLHDLDTGLSTASLTPPIRHCLDGVDRLEEVVVPAVDHRGAPMSCRAVCTSLTVGDRTEGVILWLEELDSATSEPIR